MRWGELDGHNCDTNCFTDHGEYVVEYFAGKILLYWFPFAKSGLSAWCEIEKNDKYYLEYFNKQFSSYWYTFSNESFGELCNSFNSAKNKARIHYRIVCEMIESKKFILETKWGEKLKIPFEQITTIDHYRTGRVSRLVYVGVHMRCHSVVHGLTSIDCWARWID